MKTGKSYNKIKEMCAEKRFEMAKSKLSNSKGLDVLSNLIQHIKVNQNTRWIVYDSSIRNQIPISYAAHAFNELQRTVLSYEVIRICTFWDRVDLDSFSIPTIVALADCEKIKELVYESHYNQYIHEPKLPTEVRRNLAKAAGEKGRGYLEAGIELAKKTSHSRLLKGVQNQRHKLAHLLEKTNRENANAQKSEAVTIPQYGDERKLLCKTIETVKKLHLGLNSVGFDWDGCIEINEKNAKALWQGTRFSISTRDNS